MCTHTHARTYAHTPLMHTHTSANLTPGLGVTTRSCLFHTLHTNSQSVVVNTSTLHKYNSKQHPSSLHIHRLDKLTHIWQVNSFGKNKLLWKKQTSKWSFQHFCSQQIVNSNALERYITNTTVEVKSKVYDRKKGLGGWAISLALRRVPDSLPACPFTCFLCLLT